MSDNIIIGVHGQAQTLEGINGINAKEATGGSTNYVPEDTLKVGGKTVTQNGTYNAADDNMLGYKRVVVMDLVSEGPSKTFQDTHKHNAMIACGGRQRIFANVKKLRAKDVNNADYIVAPAPILRTKSLNVSHPGVYDVSSETDTDVYTSVFVSVSDSERDAAGFNPSNPTWQDNLPDEIRVTTPPTKTEYGEHIDKMDYTGMIVTAYKNGVVWSNANYPDGAIPLDELKLAEYKVDGEVCILPQDNSEYMDNPAYNYRYYSSRYAEFVQGYNLDDTLQEQYVRLIPSAGSYKSYAYNIDKPGYNRYIDEIDYTIHGQAVVYEITSSYTGNKKWVTVILFSAEPFNVVKRVSHTYEPNTIDERTEEEKNEYISASMTVKGLTHYYYGFTFYEPSMYYQYWDTSPSYSNTEYEGAGVQQSNYIFHTILYGSKGYLISWDRPIDKKTLQTMLCLE